MEIWETNKLILFIAFVIPGFVSMKAYELIFPAQSRDSSGRIIDAVAYSCFNYAVMLLPILMVESSALRTAVPTAYALFYVFVLLISPLLLTCLVRYIRYLSILQKWLPHPVLKPWDYVFGQRASYWVVVTLNDGRRLGGKYCRKSFASSAPAIEQIYLEKCWELNDAGGFERERCDSAGVLVLSQNVASIELFHITERGQDEQQEQRV